MSEKRHGILCLFLIFICELRGLDYCISEVLSRINEVWVNDFTTCARFLQWLSLSRVALVFWFCWCSSKTRTMHFTSFEIYFVHSHIFHMITVTSHLLQYIQPASQLASYSSILPFIPLASHSFNKDQLNNHYIQEYQWDFPGKYGLRHKLTWDIVFVFREQGGRCVASWWTFWV